MRKLIIVALFLTGKAYGQTVIPSTLTVDSLSKRPDGIYTFYRVTPKDTVQMGKNTVPPCPKQRTVIRYRYNSTTRKTTFTYDDGSTTTL